MQIAEIDLCTIDDLDALCRIEAACFEQPWSRHSIEYGLEDQGPVVFIKAEIAGVIAGYCVIAHDEGCSHMMNLAVLEEYRGRGIARQLIAAMEVISIDWGYDRMILEVRPSNRNARDLYSDIGFVYQTRLKRYYSNEEDALVLLGKFPLNISGASSIDP